MPWIYEHHCNPPSTYLLAPFFYFGPQRPVGAIWECGGYFGCGKRWKVVEREVGFQSFRTLVEKDQTP